MDPLGHWAIGFIIGTLIILPFIKDISIYDYDSQKWISIKWRKRKSDQSLVLMNDTRTEPITKELHPYTRSRFVIYHLIFANLCGIIAWLPDIGHIWGSETTDHPWWIDLFFFHRTLDAMSFETSNPISVEIFFGGCAIILWIIVITYAWYSQFDNKF